LFRRISLLIKYAAVAVRGDNLIREMPLEVRARPLAVS
jgi:hypothetical protein